MLAVGTFFSTLTMVLIPKNIEEPVSIKMTPIAFGFESPIPQWISTISEKSRYNENDRNTNPKIPSLIGYLVGLLLLIVTLDISSNSYFLYGYLLRIK